MDALALLWTELIVRPMLNSLVLLYVLLWHNFGLAIIAFTFIVRALMFPLTLKQVRSTQALSRIQPRMAEIQKRYAKDPQRRSQETMRLYREAGVNPLGCLGPIVVQLPIFIGLYQALIQTVQGTPDAVVALSQKLYAWLPLVHQAIPLNNRFLWLDLALPDPTPVLPVLVGLSTWVIQKMSTPPAATPQQAQQNQIFLWMMPIFLAFISFQFPAGLALYWVVSNLVGVLIQYPITGWAPLLGRAAAPAPAVTESRGPVQGDARAPAAGEAAAPPPTKETANDGAAARGDRKDRGRGHRGRAQRTRRKKG